jgi:hypothetical protein
VAAGALERDGLDERRGLVRAAVDRERAAVDEATARDRVDGRPE